MITVCVLQQLRIISFISTLLPGASHQCLYSVDGTLSEETVGSFVEKFSESEAANPEGNSPEWDPPNSFGEIIFR